MLSARSTGYAFNRTRQAFLATGLSIAKTHWSRFRGLMGVAPQDFESGRGLWIVPSRGVHSFGMRFAIDVLYLDRNQTVVFALEGLRPWRIAPLRMRTASVLELPGHTLQATQTSIGDRIEISTTQMAEAGFTWQTS